MEHVLATGFMPDFLWGAATAAYQIEGSTRADGAGESNWDRYCAIPGMIRRGETAEIANDHYHRYREDVALMRELGLQAYRFSVLWSRIVPDGTGAVNQAGLDFYERLVDELLAANLRPFLTLQHFDIPQRLQERWGGWAGRDSAEAYADYVALLAARLGDRVRDWITLNEPYCTAWLGHALGTFPPGYREPALGLQATHHLLLGHGLATRRLREFLPDAQIGITLNLFPVRPLTQSAQDKAAAWLTDGLMNRIYLDPLFKGSYPADVLATFGDPQPGRPWLRAGDLEIIAAPLDFLGVNYYYQQIQCADPAGLYPAGFEALDAPHIERTMMGWPIYPQGLYEVLERVHSDYTQIPIYITENGIACPDELAADGKVHDEERIGFLKRHFAQMQRAIHAGIPVRGYFVWSLMDNFEWNEGYATRFGIVYVDFKTQKRVPKESARWYTSFIRTCSAAQ